MFKENGGNYRLNKFDFFLLGTVFVTLICYRNVTYVKDVLPNI